MFLTLAIKSLKNRKGSVLLTALALTVSIFVLAGVEHVRKEAKESFANTVSGVDLIVGARTGGLNLLLYSVFRVGAPANNMLWESYKTVASNNKVAWAVPISLGDSHKGYRVVGTTQEYFEHFKYGQKHALDFAEGRPFSALYDVVLGAEVARKLQYQLGDQLVLAHGVGETSFSLHEKTPFNVVGILAPTGTPVDQSLHVSLQGIEAVHIDWQHGIPSSGSLEIDDPSVLQPKQITAVLVGLNSRLATFKVQRDINNFKQEPLIAILPGVTLTELWQIMGALENTLRLVSGLIILSALLGLAAMLLGSIREREHEIQLLRAIGASPLFISSLIQLEAVLISIVSFVAGNLLLFAGLMLSQDILAARFGVHITASILTPYNAVLLLTFLAATIIISSLPAFQAYHRAKRI